MLLESGDLIPVLSDAVEIPWTKRKNQIMNFLHRGTVSFQTLVYDTNVGDISPLSTYFNPQKWTIGDLNERFGQVCDDDGRSEAASGYTVVPGAEVKSATLTPRLILYPEIAKPSNFDDKRGERGPHQGLKRDAPFPKINVWTIPPPSVLQATPNGSNSNLPSPPKTSPDVANSSGEESCDPIGPPKRRRLSVRDETRDLYSAAKLLKPRSASTSSPWTPLFSGEAFSPFLSFGDASALTTNDVFDKNDLNVSESSDDAKGVHDEQTLVRSLRKIAKAFEKSDEW